jgi:hypothetical protein
VRQLDPAGEHDIADKEGHGVDCHAKVGQREAALQVGLHGGAKGGAERVVEGDLGGRGGVGDARGVGRVVEDEKRPELGRGREALQPRHVLAVLRVARHQHKAPKAKRGAHKAKRRGGRNNRKLLRGSGGGDGARGDAERSALLRQQTEPTSETNRKIKNDKNTKSNNKRNKKSSFGGLAARIAMQSSPNTQNKSKKRPHFLNKTLTQTKSAEPSRQVHSPVRNQDR